MWCYSPMVWAVKIIISIHFFFNTKLYEIAVAWKWHLYRKDMLKAICRNAHKTTKSALSRANLLLLLHQSYSCALLYADLLHTCSLRLILLEYYQIYNQKAWEDEYVFDCLSSLIDVKIDIRETYFVCCRIRK